MFTSPDLAQAVREAEAALTEAVKSGAWGDELELPRLAYVRAAVRFDEARGRIMFNKATARKNRKGEYSAVAMAANREYLEAEANRIADFLIAKARDMREFAVERANPEVAANLAKFAEGAALSFND